MKYIKALPYNSVLDEDELTCGLWKSKENVCEYQHMYDDAGLCDTSGYYYGTADEYEPKFCARHFYQNVVSGDGKDNYKLTI
jgi:hypothetical protein